ncbi:NAD-dependent protein deacylase [Paenibacillus methanolicus]|uniref:NAD-dependent protein deacetylase n=1 Tax=Paenibacillus methanolicus TaxID=582686 RepID=A0A5S5BMW9_9BACL|nr:NAD-dependent protein deacylase [Paenibacillus methanolicus]TYP68347.1 NAD-dependent deacetylase [Paenibacillus methanolicus]
MELEQLKARVAASANIVFFGGAGVSTESDIPDFRSATGLYQTSGAGAYPPEVMLSRSFFRTHPEEFFAFYRTRMLYPDAKPNAAHEALAELERQGRLGAVITQNIDGLHQLAGSKRVLELHGSVLRNSCLGCGRKYNLDYILNHPDTVPTCGACGEIVRPDVVLYEENLDLKVLLEAADCIAAADLLIVGGTSLTVNPAAGLVTEYEGDGLVLINMTATPYDSRASFVIREPIGQVMRALVPKG